MHLLAISLLTILAGTLLLAKFRKDMPGKFFTFISWFFIVVGFLLFIGFIGGGICRMTNQGFPGYPNCQHEMTMRNCTHGMQGGFCCQPGMDKERSCCPQGMDKGHFCCPQGMDKRMGPVRPGCMSNDSMMKVCPRHMKGDSAKMPVLKK